MTRKTWLRAFSLLPVLAACAVVSLTASVAAEPGYRFADIGWVKVDPDNSSSDNAAFLGASFNIRNVHFFGEYLDVDNATWEAGAGWHGLLGEKADLVLQASFYDADVDDGLRLSAGIRWMVLEKLEVNGFFNYTDLDLSDLNVLEVNGIWLFARWFGVGGGFEWGDEANTARVFARFNFSGR